MERFSDDFSVSIFSLTDWFLLLSLLGHTIDFGPFGFVSAYSADYVPNTSDENGLYSFKNQPNRVHWSILRLIESVGGNAKWADRTSINIEYFKLRSSFCSFFFFKGFPEMFDQHYLVGNTKSDSHPMFNCDSSLKSQNPPTCLFVCFSD